MRNKPHKILKFILGAFLLCLFSTIAFTHSTFAVTTKNLSSGQLKKLASYKLGGHSQGGTVTEKYYLYTNWYGDGSTTTLVRCKRSNPTDCKNIAKGKWGHASTVYNKWGTDVVNIVDSHGSRDWCINFETGKDVDNNCAKIKPDGLSRKTTTGLLQGYTKYGNYYLRGWGNSKNKPNEIRVYNKNKTLTKIFYLPNSIDEIEGIGVDGNTGDIIFTAVIYTSRGKVLNIYQVASSVINLGSDSTETRTAEKSVVDKNPKTEEYSYESQYEYDGTVDTLFFGTLQEDGEGCGIYTVLDLVITTLTMGIGIAAAIGISISGIMYLTAKGNVARATKAKRRIYEIVIGLIAYAAIFAILTFLLPELNPELKSCKVLTTEEVAARDAARKEAREAAAKAAAEAKAKETDTTTEKTNGGNKTNADIREELARVAKELAQSKKKYLAAFESSGTKAWEAARCRVKHQCNAARREGKSCSSFVATVVRTVIPSQKKKYGGGFPTVAYPTIYNYVKNPKNNWKEISKSQAEPGDIEIQHGPKGQSDSHVSIIYAKTKSGKLKVAEASNGTSWPHLTDGNKNYHPGLKGWPKYYRYTGN